MKKYKLWELEEGVAYRDIENEIIVEYDGCDIISSYINPKRHDLNRIDLFENWYWRDILELDFIEDNSNWFPKDHEKYWFPSVENLSGVKYYWYDPHNPLSESLVKMLKERVGVYRTEAEAMEKAKELGWV